MVIFISFRFGDEGNKKSPCLLQILCRDKSENSCGATTAWYPHGTHSRAAPALLPVTPLLCNGSTRLVLLRQVMVAGDLHEPSEGHLMDRFLPGSQHPRLSGSALPPLLPRQRFMRCIVPEAAKRASKSLLSDRFTLLKRHDEKKARERDGRLFLVSRQ